MRLPGAKAIRKSAHWLHSRFLRGALILGYHRIGQVEVDPYALHVSAAHFVEQLEVLCRRAKLLPLQQVLTGLRDRQLPRRAVALTFDDGYAEMLHVVLPILERFDVPATVFVTAGYLGQEFWWHELARRFEGRTTVGALPVSARRSPREDTRLGTIPRGYYEHLAELGWEQREAELAEVRASAANGTNELPSIRCLTSGEVTQLAENELITIGAHGVTHRMLARCPVACQQWEIQESKARLQALSPRPVTLFSYPHGSMTATTRALVADAGFVGACASANAVAWSGSDLFGLPRFWVPDWNGETFGRWLEWWLCR
jgi:peptidoglycan/xylan/chitin deacetylase (PgdA/CDA1 family)